MLLIGFELTAIPESIGSVNTGHFAAPIRSHQFWIARDRGTISKPRDGHHFRLPTRRSLILQISHSGLDSTRRYEHQSPEITDQDDVAALAAAGQRQLLAVRRPFKIGNQSRLKIRNLFRRSAR